MAAPRGDSDPYEAYTSNPEAYEPAEDDTPAPLPSSYGATAATPPDTAPTPAPAAPVPTAVAQEPTPAHAMLELLRQMNTRLERIAIAVERQQSAQVTGTGYPTATQPVPWNTPSQAAAISPQGTWVCPVHGQVKIVPAGTSQRTGKPYPAFAACPIRDCNERPPR